MKRKSIIIFSCLLLALICILSLLLFPREHIPYEIQIKEMNYFYKDEPRRINVDVTFNNPWLYKFDVISLKEAVTARVPWGGYTDYNVCITYDYLNDREESFSAIVRIHGTPQVQVYSVPRLVPGKSYVMISGELDKNNDIAAYAFVFKQWEHEGTTYIYPYSNLDSRIFGSGENFEFVEELSVYDSENDYDVLEYMEENNIEVPVFQYKYEINSFVVEFSKFRQKVLESLIE